MTTVFQATGFICERQRELIYDPNVMDMLHRKWEERGAMWTIPTIEEVAEVLFFCVIAKKISEDIEAASKGENTSSRNLNLQDVISWVTKDHNNPSFDKLKKAISVLVFFATAHCAEDQKEMCYAVIEKLRKHIGQHEKNGALVYDVCLS